MNNPYPKISIVTPSYNQGSYIEACIQSVLNQNYPNFEHIILDNCSSDQTVDILKKYDHLIWKSEPDRGQSDALNRGFQMATGDIIGWLNADDLYLPHCFHQVADWLDSHAPVDVVYGDYRWIDQAGNVFQQRQEIDFDSFILKYLHVLYIHSTATFFRRRIFDQGNFLDVSLGYSMDYEFFLRLVAQGYKIGHVKAYLADFRWHDNNKSVVGSKKQIHEMNQALLAHDQFIQQLPNFLHPLGFTLLRYSARLKRVYLKASKGHYLTQWQPRSIASSPEGRYPCES